MDGGFHNRKMDELQLEIVLDAYIYWHAHIKLELWETEMFACSFYGFVLLYLS